MLNNKIFILLNIAERSFNLAPFSIFPCLWEFAFSINSLYSLDMGKKSALKTTGKPIKNYNHEKFAHKVAESILTPGKPVNATEIYSQVYGAPRHVAGSGGHELIKKPEIRTRVQELLDANGMSLEHLSKKLQKLQAAKKPIYFEGRKIDEIEDNDIQLKATKLGFELQRAMPTATDVNAQQINIDARSINLELGDPKNIEKLAMIAQTFRSLHDEKKNKSGVVKVNDAAPSAESSSTNSLDRNLERRNDEQQAEYTAEDTDTSSN